MPEPTSRKRGELRPGAMTAAMRAARPPIAGPRHLRWARLQDGRIVEEHVIDPSRAFTVGPDGDLEWAVLNRKRPLLVPRGETWTLRVGPELRGKAHAGTVQQLAEGAPRGDDGWREVTLPRDARLRLELDDVVLLVQLVDPPVERQARPLPAGMQRGVLAGTDWWFASFVACSFVLHFGVVSYLSQADFPIERALLPSEYFVVPIYADPEPPPDDDVPAEDLDPDGEEVTDDAEEQLADNRNDVPRPSPVRHSTPGDATDPTLNHDEIAIEAGRAAVNDVLGALTGAMGDVVNDIQNGQEYRPAEEIIAGVTHNAPTGRRPGELEERDTFGGGAPPCGGDTGIRCLGVNGRRHVGPAVGGDEIVETVVRPPHVTSPGGPEVWDPPPGWNRQELVRALRSRMRAIQACYERELTHGNPDLAGRLTLSMTVMPAGLLSEVQAAENTTGSTTLAGCAVRIVRGIRLRSAPDSPVDAEFPVVFARTQ